MHLKNVPNHGHLVADDGPLNGLMCFYVASHLSSADLGTVVGGLPLALANCTEGKCYTTHRQMWGKKGKGKIRKREKKEKMEMCCMFLSGESEEKQLKALGQQIPETGECGKLLFCYQTSHIHKGIWLSGCLTVSVEEYKDVNSLTIQQTHISFSVTRDPKLQQLKKKNTKTHSVPSAERGHEYSIFL